MILYGNYHSGKITTIKYSNHADYKNIGNSGFGGAITAALFLEKFIKKKIPWIHIDLVEWTRP